MSAVKRTMASIIVDHAKGESKHYDQLVQQCSRLSVASTAPVELEPIVGYVTQNLDALNGGTCRRLVNALLDANWSKLSETQMKCHANFVFDLCSMCPHHAHAAVESLVRRFLIDDTQSCVDNERQSQSDDIVHHTIERLINRMPSLSMPSSALMKQLNRQFPHTAGSTSKVRRYALNVLRTTMYVPTAMKQHLFAVIVERLVMMDTAVTRRGDDENMFEMDDGEEEYKEEAHRRDDGVSCTCAHRCDQRLTLDLCLVDMCRFMDACLTGLIPLVRDAITDVPQWSNGRVVYEWLSDAFLAHVLPAYNISSVPAIWLALCAHDGQVAEHHLNTLWQQFVQVDDTLGGHHLLACSTTRRRRVESHSTSSPTNRVHAVCHMSSLLATTVLPLHAQWLPVWTTWTTEYIDNLEHSPSSSHAPYFACVHAIAHVVVHRHAQMDDAQLAAVDPRRFVECALRPLLHTFPSTAAAFVDVVRRRCGGLEVDDELRDHLKSSTTRRNPAAPFIPIAPYDGFALPRAGAMLGQLYRRETGNDVGDEGREEVVDEGGADEGREEVIDGGGRDEGRNEIVEEPPKSIPISPSINAMRRRKQSSNSSSTTKYSIGDYDYVMGSYQRGTTPVL